MKVRFVANPTGKFNLSYNVGDEVIIEAKQAMLLIEGGVAEEIAVLTPTKKKAKPVNPETELDAE